MGFWPRFILAVFATWRVTHLLASEDGPADLVARFRALLGRSIAGALMDCFNCLSLWVAVAMALLVTREPRDLVLTWLALSGAACLLERLGYDPVMLHPAIGPDPATRQTEGDPSDGMLRSETRLAPEPAPERPPERGPDPDRAAKANGAGHAS